MTVAAAVLALSVPSEVVSRAGALAGGYLVGALPLAALVLGVRRARGRAVAVPAGGPAPATRRQSATLVLLAEGGLRITVMVVLLELLKGAVVGLGARVYDDSAVFAAYAIAGCVVGDAFPPGRPGRRGVVPLVSGTFTALPGAWAAGVVIALPALVVVALSGAFEATVIVCVPLALLLGTRDIAVLVPAAVIVVTLIGRQRLRRRAQARAAEAWRGGSGAEIPMVIDQPAR
jgi:hypothetical protein